MKVTDIIIKSAKPTLYEEGTSFMWTDEHISKQLLNIHLNPEIDLASRKESSIIKTASWILNTQKSKRKLKILDLGCGPGLYTEIFAQNGHDVTGIDISKTSINYAKESAIKKNLDINYINANYLNVELDYDQYDLVVMIFTDFGVLKSSDRSVLLSKVHSTLKDGGTFIFDALRDTDIHSKIAPNSWEALTNGFWRPTPYVALSQSFLYEEQKVILFQHMVYDSQEELEIYRFYTHFFSQSDITEILSTKCFSDVSFQQNVLPEDGMWNGNNVIFAIATK
ncbi:class I SAM-dependent methyltransferase [Puteibacter caeruleilacunae]|nr:class I SAM-dependent methyltransferase [Puteibacter caeruleilacunae]